MDTIEVIEQNFNEIVLNSHIPVTVHFWTPWCKPCRQLSFTIRDLEIKFVNKIKFVKVNVDDNKNLSDKYSINSLPTIIVFNDNQPVLQIIGNEPLSFIENKLITLLQNLNER